MGKNQANDRQVMGQKWIKIRKMDEKWKKWDKNGYKMDKNS